MAIILFPLGPKLLDGLYSFPVLYLSLLLRYIDYVLIIAYLVHLNRLFLIQKSQLLSGNRQIKSNMQSPFNQRFNRPRIDLIKFKKTCHLRRVFRVLDTNRKRRRRDCLADSTLIRSQWPHPWSNTQNVICSIYLPESICDFIFCAILLSKVHPYYTYFSFQL